MEEHLNRLKYRAALLASKTIGWMSDQSRTHRGSRVLMFHDVSGHTVSNDIYSVPRRLFESQVEHVVTWATSQGRQFVELAVPPADGIAWTFDDGYRSSLAIVAPLFSTLKIPLCVFVSRQYVESGDSRYLSRSEVIELSSYPNITLGTHGVSHRRLTELNPSELRHELMESREWLEDLIGQSVNSLSYPHGASDGRVVQEVAAAGYVLAAGSSIGTYRDIRQRFQIPRIDIWSLDSPSTVVSKLSGRWDALLK